MGLQFNHSHVLHDVSAELPIMYLTALDNSGAP